MPQHRTLCVINPAHPGVTIKVPFFRPCISEAAIDAVGDTLRSGWLTTGSKTRRFEDEFASYVGAEYAVAVNSCTAALHLSLAALDIGPGDEVIVPTMTFAATAEVVTHLGATPVLVDVIPGDLNIDPNSVAAAISDATRAIVPVHYGGNPARMADLLSMANDHGIAIVEDAAHALPAATEGRRVGTIGTTTCFSFYANKTITTGEGGMITTSDADLAERMRMLSLHGLSRDAWTRMDGTGVWDYQILAAGYKYNTTDIASTIGIHQLQRSDEFRAARARIASRYDEIFSPIAGIEPLEVASNVDHAWHLYVVRVGEPASGVRDAMIHNLTSRGIGTSVHYRPLHMHPYFVDRFGDLSTSLPVATTAFSQVLSLPIFPDLTAEELEFAAASVVEAFHEERRR